MSDDETRPIEPEQAPMAPPAAPPGFPAYDGTETPPPYAMPLPSGAYPTYAVPQRPRFVDQVLGMRGVIAVALACLLIGGLSGWILGRASADGNDRFGPGPGSFQQRGAFPGPGQRPFQPPSQSQSPNGG
jgi:hypothetical protein